MTDRLPVKRASCGYRHNGRVAGPCARETWYVAGAKFTPVAGTGPRGMGFSTQLAKGLTRSNFSVAAPPIQ
jgi:hypothetical protein